MIPRAENRERIGKGWDRKRIGTVKYGNFGHVDALKMILKFGFYSYHFLIFFNHSIKFRGSICKNDQVEIANASPFFF